MVGHSPEFFLTYYLGFRLPEHQVNWIQLWLNLNYLLELAPRDHGKSWLFSYGLPLWEIYASFVRSKLLSVDVRILQVSKTDEQAGKYAGQVRRSIESNRYLLQDFGDIRDSSQWHKDSFRCVRQTDDSEEKDHTYEKTGVLGSITGGHFHRVVLDDILDDENVKTADRIQSVTDWFWGTIWNLREPYTKYMMVGTRKNRRDIYQSVLESPTWRSNVEKAIIEYPYVDDPNKPGSMMNGWRYLTDKGRSIAHQSELNLFEKIVDIELLTDNYKVLWPPTQAVDNDGNPVTDPNTGTPILFGWGIKALLLDRLTQGSVYFDREKQNNISSEEGAIFQKEWFKFFSTEDLIYNPTDGYYYLEGEIQA